MAQYLPYTIKKVMDNIEDEKLILPAMQRNFVWEEAKIEKLFDSIMHDYPIGTFMFWSVNENDFNNYQFTKFVKHYKDNREGYHRGEPAKKAMDEHQAVLDGQQRITSFYIGIHGSWRTHIKYADWSKEESFFNRYFCINVLQSRSSDEQEYEFGFIDEVDISKELQKDKDHFWVKVGDIVDEKMEKPDQIMDEATDNFPSLFTSGKGTAARVMLRKLNNAICNNFNVHYYLAENRSLSEVGEMFVRVNNGGQKLSYSDLMLSVAVSELNGQDIHEIIAEKVTYINSKADDETGFKVDSELILTAGLMFTNAQSLSLRNQNNYSPAQIKAIFEDNWEAITNALAVAVEYIEYIGFAGKKLTSKNLILPVAYYFYANNIDIAKEKGGNARAVCDFIFIRQWLLRAMINGVFSDGIGATLINLRNHISSSNKYFPLDELIKEHIKKPLEITDEKIEDIFEYKKGDARVIPLLMELAHENTSKKYDADHIWPRASLYSNSAIKKICDSLGDDEIKKFKFNCDRFANIEILDPGVNKTKNDTLYGQWLENNPQPTSYFESKCIPTEVSYEYEDFLDFISARKELLTSRIKEAFPDNFSDIVKRYSLEQKIK